MDKRSPCAVDNDAEDFVLDAKSFAAITALEGLKLSTAGELRLSRTGGKSPAKRREETIRAFRKSTQHG